MSINVRTVSQLYQIEKEGIIPYGDSSNFIEISKRETNGYKSLKCSTSDLNELICQNSDISIANKYNLSTDEGIVDVGFISKNMNNLLSGDIDIRSNVTFFNAPKTYYPENYSDDTIPNVELVKDIILDNGQYISNNSKVKSTPLNTSDGGQTFDGSIYDNTKFQYFHFDDGTTDSSKYIDQETGKPVGPVTISNTGELVIYGWLSDNGKILPQECWVALMGLIMDENNSSQWIPLQVKPWIVGSNSHLLQYVSFNARVRSGMQLKICTGFKVNNYSQGGMITGNSLLFKQIGSIPNTFISYVIEG